MRVAGPQTEHIASLLAKVLVWFVIVYGVAGGLAFGISEQDGMQVVRVGLLVTPAMMLFVAIMSAGHIRRGGMRVPLVRQEAALKATGSLAATVAKAESALAALRVKRIDRRREAGLRLRARVPMSWRSWGERIQLHFSDARDGSVDVTVLSTPAFPLTLWDSGKSAENVALIVAALRSNDVGVPHAS